MKFLSFMELYLAMERKHQEDCGLQARRRNPQCKSTAVPAGELRFVGPGTETCCLCGSSLDQPITLSSAQVSLNLRRVDEMERRHCVRPLRTFPVGSMVLPPNWRSRHVDCKFGASPGTHAMPVGPGPGLACRSWTCGRGRPRRCLCHWQCCQ